MFIEFKDYLSTTGTALVLHGERELVDADLLRLREFSEAQRAAVTTVVLSNTHITSDSFRYLILLPNLIALYGAGIRVTEAAPIGRLPKSLEILNLDRTNLGDRHIPELRNLPRLRLISLRHTLVTDKGLHLLGALPNLREYYLDGTIVSDYAKQRLDNAIELGSTGFVAALGFVLSGLQIRAEKLIRRAS